MAGNQDQSHIVSSSSFIVKDPAGNSKTEKKGSVTKKQ